MILYSGGESSRIYDGEWLVKAWFTWPDGTPGDHETVALPYTDCMDWLASAPYLPLIAVDGATGQTHQVRIERAVIEAA